MLNPFIKNIEDSLKLALCNLILESATKPYFVADFLFKFINKFIYFYLFKSKLKNFIEIKTILMSKSLK